MSPFETTPRRTPIAYDRVQATPGNWLRNYGRPIHGLDAAGGPSLQSLLRPNWMRGAVCASVDPELWFEESDTPAAHLAISLCHECPVRAMCLASALVFREEYGVSGGLTPSERRPLETRLALGEPLGKVLRSGLRHSEERNQQGAA